MRAYFLIFVLVLIATAAGDSQEAVVLTTPPPGVTQYSITELQLTWGDGTPTTCRIIVRLKPNVADVAELRHDYTSDTACMLIKALNKANLTTVSLQRRVMNQLITDKVLSGTVTGTPE